MQVSAELSQTFQRTHKQKVYTSFQFRMNKLMKIERTDSMNYPDVTDNWFILCGDGAVRYKYMLSAVLPTESF